MLNPTKILVPTDFSDHSDKALEEALDIAQQFKATLLLLHVVHENIHHCAGDYCLSDELLRQIEDNMLSGARDAVRKQLGKFPQAANVQVVTEIRWGAPAEEIIQVQEEKGADLIVISPLGKTGIAKYLMGSVTNNVAKGASCSVLILR
jgi:nucleotide-binding universal stress UspA family protein